LLRSSQGGELTGAEAVATVVKQREVAVVSLHGGAAALEEVSAVGGGLLEVRLLDGGQALDGAFVTYRSPHGQHKSLFIKGRTP
jgi:hypothetical protein